MIHPDSEVLWALASGGTLIHVFIGLNNELMEVGERHGWPSPKLMSNPKTQQSTCHVPEDKVHVGADFHIKVKTDEPYVECVVHANQ